MNHTPTLPPRRALSIRAAGFALLLAGTGPVEAQEREERPDGGPVVESSRDQAASPELESGESRWWLGLRGAPEPNRLYLGNWALHLKRMEDGLSAHHLLGATWRGFYLATFVNTHERRTWSAGVGRYLISMEGSGGSLQFGYRAGLLAGYDHRLMAVAERWPAIPAAQITADARFRRVGMQAGWSWIVVTFGGFIAL
jgi:hypothetical protein